jgi:hypothetical protein
MKVLDWIAEEAPALVVAALVAVISAIGVLALAIFIGAKFVRGELGAWFGILPGLPAALVAAGAVFAIVFLKVRTR